MTINVSIPPGLQPFVEAELATGAFADESELVAKALELFRELSGKHQSLRNDVQASIEQAERGEVTPLNTERIKDTLRAEFNESDQGP